MLPRPRENSDRIGLVRVGRLRLSFTDAGKMLVNNAKHLFRLMFTGIDECIFILPGHELRMKMSGLARERVTYRLGGRERYGGRTRNASAGKDRIEVGIERFRQSSMGAEIRR